MSYKTIIALPVLVFAMGEAAYAGQVIPDFSPVLSTTTGSGSIPTTQDYTFDQSGLSGALSQSGTGWTLTVSSTAGSVGAFYAPNYANLNSPTVYTVTNEAYTLTANYSTNGTFTGGKLEIDGTVSGTPAGTTAPTSSVLLTADLTKFGYNANQATIGFLTTFTGGWADQPVFTGGSSGDVVYLFNQGGLANGLGVLTPLINQFATGNFSATTFANAESLAAVPLPMPAVLFGTGLTALMGFARQRRNISKSI